MIKVMLKLDTILEMVRQHRVVSFTELQRQSAINKATLSQILKSMTELKWLDRQSDGGFRIGRQLTTLARAELGRESLRHAASEAVAWLAAETGEMASVSVLDGLRRVRLAKQEGKNELLANEQTAAPGQKLTSTATGILLLAYEQPETREKVIASEIVPEERSDWLARLDQVRSRRVSLAISPNGQIKSLACPVFATGEDELAAAIGISVPAYQCTAERQRQWLDKIAKAASLIEEIIKPGSLP